MSNYIKKTKHPETGKIEEAEWLDDYFGSHKYVVRFPDGKVYYAWEIEEDNLINNNYERFKKNTKRL